MEELQTGHDVAVCLVTRSSNTLTGLSQRDRSASSHPAEIELGAVAVDLLVGGVNGDAGVELDDRHIRRHVKALMAALRERIERGLHRRSIVSHAIEHGARGRKGFLESAKPLGDEDIWREVDRAGGVGRTSDVVCPRRPWQGGRGLARSDQRSRRAGVQLTGAPCGDQRIGVLAVIGEEVGGWHQSPPYTVVPVVRRLRDCSRSTSWQ